jgi:hypothetical protein
MSLITEKKHNLLNRLSLITEVERESTKIKREEKVKRLIENIIMGYEDDYLELMPQAEQRLYKKLQNLISILPSKLRKALKEKPWEATEDLMRYFLYKDVEGIYATYLLLKTFPHHATTVSFWRDQGYNLRENDLRLLMFMGYISFDFKYGLDNITVIQ